MRVKAENRMVTHRIGRHIQEILPEIVNDIDALISRAGERLSRPHIFRHTAVVKLLREPDLIVGYEEIVYHSIHIQRDSLR